MALVFIFLLITAITSSNGCHTRGNFAGWVTTDLVAEGYEVEDFKQEEKPEREALDSYEYPEDNFNSLPKESWFKNETVQIVGGYRQAITIVPYYAGYGHTCGATIIAKSWLITAAHCGDVNDHVYVGSAVVLRGSKKFISEHHIHPKWCDPKKAHLLDYDYQLLKLKEPLIFNANIQPIKLGRFEDIKPGVNLMVSGWGKVADDGDTSRNLLSVIVPIVPKDVCQKVKFEYFAGTLTQRMFCAGFVKGQKDACQGDSGGGAIAHNRIVGVVSFGYRCAYPDTYGVYSSIAEAREWIQTTTKITFD